MKYLALICATIAFFLGLYAYYLDSRLSYTKQKLTLAESEKNALETEVREYNEKSLQASQQIYELRQLIQKNKESESDGYRCLFVVLPDDVRQLLVGKNK
jgi:hypothetical protein